MPSVFLGMEPRKISFSYFKTSSALLGVQPGIKHYSGDETGEQMALATPKAQGKQRREAKNGPGPAGTKTPGDGVGLETKGAGQSVGKEALQLDRDGERLGLSLSPSWVT